MMTCPESRKRDVGFTLIEVLIAIVVFSLGVLGIGAMLVVMHKTSTSSYLQQEAVQYAYDIVDRMHANQAAAKAGSYNVASGTAPPVAPSCLGALCTPAQIATYDQSEWLTGLNTSLPNGTGSIATALLGSSTTVTVTISWDDSPTQKTLGETVAPATYALTTVL